MKKKLLHILMVMAMLTGVAGGVSASAKGWEPMRGDVSAMKSVVQENEIEVRVSSGQIVVTTSHQTQVKIFTILGQMVSSESLAPGVSRLALPHGVYIVKVGDLTCKVAV